MQILPQDHLRLCPPLLRALLRRRLAAACPLRGAALREYRGLPCRQKTKSQTWPLAPSWAVGDSSLWTFNVRLIALAGQRSQRQPLGRLLTTNVRWLRGRPAQTATLRPSSSASKKNWAWTSVRLRWLEAWAHLGLLWMVRILCETCWEAQQATMSISCSRAAAQTRPLRPASCQMRRRQWRRHRMLFLRCRRQPWALLLLLAAARS